MIILPVDIPCNSRKFRLEIFPFGDLHIGKRNCAETLIRKQVVEVKRRNDMENRQAVVICGGDLLNSINVTDVRRFDFDELADWFVDSDAEKTRERLSNMALQEVDRCVDIFNPIKHLMLGAITGNHENMMRKRNNLNVHKLICEKLGIANLTDEAIIVFKFTKTNGTKQNIKLYIRHGYGGGRTPGAEPNKLARMLAEWEDCNVCLTGHSHTYCLLPPKPVLYVNNTYNKLLQRYRFAANWGCWQYSHLEGVGSYESAACYPASPMMTLKVVIWPFWSTRIDGKEVMIPKIELREYPIL